MNILEARADPRAFMVYWFFWIILVCVLFILSIRPKSNQHLREKHSPSFSTVPAKGWDFEGTCARMRFAGFSLITTNIPSSDSAVIATKQGIDVAAVVESRAGVVWRVATGCSMPILAAGINREQGSSETSFVDAVTAAIAVNLTSLEFKALVEWHLEPISSPEKGRSSFSKRTKKFTSLTAESLWSVTEHNGKPALIEVLTIER